LSWQLSKCRHCRSEVWSWQGNVSEHSGQQNIVPEGCSTNTSTCCRSEFSVTFDTDHGLFNPRIAWYSSRSCMGTLSKKRNHTKSTQNPFGPFFEPQITRWHR
jgi:hypothetical protein